MGMQWQTWEEGIRHQHPVVGPAYLSLCLLPTFLCFLQSQNFVAIFNWSLILIL